MRHNVASVAGRTRKYGNTSSRTTLFSAPSYKKRGSGNQSNFHRSESRDDTGNGLHVLQDPSESTMDLFSPFVKCLSTI